MESYASADAGVRSQPHCGISCGDILKTYICEHTIGTAVELNQFDLPKEAWTGGLGVRRGPGRPKKCSKALRPE